MFVNNIKEGSVADTLDDNSYLLCLWLNARKCKWGCINSQWPAWCLKFPTCFLERLNVMPAFNWTKCVQTFPFSSPVGIERAASKYKQVSEKRRGNCGKA